MKALPSIAFNEFKGTAGDVTARKTGGRTVLNGRAQHSHIKTPKQSERRASFGYITKQFKQLTAQQQIAWQKLAEAHRERALVGSEGVPLTAHNLFVCLNANRSLVGVPLALDAPEQIHGSDAIAFDDIWITPDWIMISGLRDADNPNARLVVKMSPGQGPGISKAWDKTVIVGDFATSDWGDLDLLEVYTKSFGIDVIPGHKYFLELYWIDEFSGYVSSKTYICFPATEGESAHGQTFSPRARLQSNDVTGGDSSSEAIYCDYEQATFGTGIVPESNRLVVKEDFVYASIPFSKFPSTNNGYGPFSIKIKQMPEDVDAIVPVCLQSGTYIKGQVGSWLGEARIQGGYISMNLNEDFSNYGGKGSFLIFFAPRHQFIPRVPGVGKIFLSTDDVTCGNKTNMQSLLLEIGGESGISSLELEFIQDDSFEGISFYLAEYPDYAKYEMKMPVLSRGGTYGKRHTVAPQIVSFSEYNKSISLRNLIRSTTMETSIFDASIISDIIYVSDI